MGFLVICAGVVLLQLSKSAKDVPDTQVFTGDLDQVRTVAEQEEHESEPKADAIRGTAALIRSFSRNKQRREEDEAKRVHIERLEPIAENELVEWEGVRRRKTVLAPGESARPTRTKTVHPPLGLTRPPSGTSLRTEDEIVRDSHGHSGLFTFHGLGGRGRKAQTVVLNPLHGSKRSKRDFSGESDLAGSVASAEADGKAPYRMASMSAVRRDASGSSKVSYGDSDDGDLAAGGQHVFGLPPGLQHEADTTYHSPRGQGVHFVDQPRPVTASTGPPPTPPPHGAAGKRMFSFQNVFGSKSSRGGESADLDGQRSPPLAPVSPGYGSSSGHSRGFFGRKSASRSGGTVGGVSEEERLGLVQGDASAEQTPEKDSRSGRRGTRDLESDDVEGEDSSEEFESIGMRDFGERSHKGGSESEGSDGRRPGGKGALV